MAILTLTLRIEEIRALANFAHWIPMIHGYTREFMNETYPGWQWNEIIPNMRSQGYVTYTPEENDINLRQGLFLKQGITEITVIKKGDQISFEVKREDESS